MRKVVITGLGAVTPIGNTVPAFNKALMLGQQGAGPITRFDTTSYKTTFGCEVKNFDPLCYMNKVEARKRDLFTQFALAAAAQAIAQAFPGGLAGINLHRAGIIIGAANGGTHTYEQQVKEFCKGNGSPAFHPMFVPMMMANAASGSISIQYGFKGPNYVTVAACASSNIALADALHKIRYGQADIMLAGGTEASISEAAVGGFISMKALSSNNDTTACRPFDKTRDGFVIGEGAALLLLEAEEHALRRGAAIIAELAGGAITSDAGHMVAPHTNGEGAAMAMQLALQDAGMTAPDIDYLNAHATSTPVGDLCEIAAIRNIFGDAPAHLRISATKASYGHLLGAAGVLGVIAALHTLESQQVPPTINTTTLDPAIPPTLPIVLQTSVPHVINTVMCNSFGFGGHNAIIICKKYVPTRA